MDAAQEERFRDMLEELRGDGNRLCRNAETKPDSVMGEDGHEIVSNGINPAQMKSIGKELLKDVEAALKRLDNGTFGKCQECDNSIPEGRLERLPYVKRCAPCQQAYDKSKSRRFKGYD